jgi:hypothetical protein
MRMLRLLRVVGFRTSVGVPPHKGEPFHEGEPAQCFENRGRFDNFDSEWSVCRAWVTVRIHILGLPT